MRDNNMPANQLLVIFGASGDLAGRKLFPSLFELYTRGLLPDKFAVLGASRSEYTEELFRYRLKAHILSALSAKTVSAEQLELFLQQVYYVSFDTNLCEEYTLIQLKIKALLIWLDSPDKVLYYLATPPVMYDVIPPCLKAHGLSIAETAAGWRRIVIEKPFGSDLASAIQLGGLLRSIFKEDEIYRIDHYLGKETVQNILVLRFANGIFEPLWNRNYIDFVEISATETLGVEGRGKYYESAGALRDMIQNHLLQLLAFTAMEAPATFDPEAIRDEIVKVYKSIRPYTPEQIDQDVIRAQYKGRVLNGETFEDYRSEPNVAKDSVVETFVAMKLYIDNWRWGGVPFFIRTGKRLAEKKSEITIHFKSTPTQLFVGQCSGSSCNKLTIRIQPDENISLKFGLKMPGSGYVVEQVSMDFRYDSLQKKTLPDAYERLLLDAMLGDATLYARSDAQQASWRFIDPILKHWKELGDQSLLFYSSFTNGPKEQQMLLTENRTIKAVDFVEKAPHCDAIQTKTE